VSCKKTTYSIVEKIFTVDFMFEIRKNNNLFFFFDEELFRLGLHLYPHGRDRATESITRRSPTLYRNNSTQPLQRISADIRHHIQSQGQPQCYWFPKVTISDSPVQNTAHHKKCMTRARLRIISRTLHYLIPHSISTNYCKRKGIPEGTSY
jgi:hypothetical protein